MSSGIKRLGIKPTYSEAVIHKDIVYLSGQVPWVTAGQSIQAQTKEVFDLVDVQLQLAGTDKTKILSMQIFLTDPQDYSEMNKIFIQWMPNGSAPARNTICGVKFPKSEWLIEVVVTAYIK
jgi:enamine deaminase RidA (YjgF/YER057c/UK114 family)